MSNAFPHAWLPSTCHWTLSPAGSAVPLALPDGPYGWSHAAVFMQLTVLQLHFLLLGKATQRLVGSNTVCEAFGSRLPSVRQHTQADLLPKALTARCLQVLFVYISMQVTLWNGS